MSADVTGRADEIIRKLLGWYDREQRTFSFRGTRDPYRVWLSEIMLQQTRTETVGPYYERFLDQFPDVFSLAAAQEEQVLKAWQGLGYYTRARNLHKAARIIVQEHGGRFPGDARGLGKLPGIGPYTAAAIASIAYDEPVPAMDGNLNRVISRLYHFTHEITAPDAARTLRSLGQGLMPPARAGDMNQALMDLGATICLPGTPDCGRCPLQAECLALAQGDPAALPRIKARKPPVQVSVAVVLLVCGDRVLLTRRREALLKGMYVFPLREGDDGPEAALALAQRVDPGQTLVREETTARHVFTHRVWNMRVYSARVASCAALTDGVWADMEALKRLPLPVAMSAARQAAERLLLAGGD